MKYCFVCFYLIVSEEGEGVQSLVSETLKVSNEVKTDETVLQSDENKVVQPAPIIADTVTKTVEPVQMKKSGLGSKLWSKITPSKVYGDKKTGALSFVATEEVWIKVMQDNKVILEEILYKGDRYNVPADTNYTLTTANAGALTVYVNGKKKNILGSKGVLAENVVLNPENFN